LYLTPVVYTYMAALTAYVSNWKRRRAAATGKLVSVEP
jgi:hypothetical protein